MISGKDLIQSIIKEQGAARNLLEYVRKFERFKEDEKCVSRLSKVTADLAKFETLLEQTKLNNDFKDVLKSYIIEVRAVVSKRSERSTYVLSNQLQENLKLQGLELIGQYPRFSASLYTLKVSPDNETLTIWYGPEQEKLDSVDFIPEQVAVKIKEQNTKITGRDFDNIRFISNLYHAYKNVLSKGDKDKKIGEQVPIVDVLAEYVFLIQDKNFKINPSRNLYKDYGRVFLSYDLSRLKERRINEYELKLVTASKAYTGQRSGFLWVPSSEGGTVVSHIKFTEVQK